MTTEEIKVIATRAAETVLENMASEEAILEAEVAQEEKTCPNLQPMAEWIKGESPDICRPCILVPVVQWYYEELKEKGFVELAADLEAEVDVLEEDNIDQVVALCQDLDNIKSQVPEELKRSLEQFDCSIQSFDPDEFSEEVLPGDLPSLSQPHAHTLDSESISH